MKTQYLLLTALLILSSSVFGQRISFSSTSNDSLMTVSPDDSFKHAPFQFTLMCPPLSTNGLDFYKTANDISINTFLGISAGTNNFEASGFGNINLYYTNGLQLAGFANVTGVLGHDYESEGLQVAGFANLHGSSYTGMQASGFGNVCNEFSGLQAAGFANINAKANNAVEVAGFANINGKTEETFQAAGFANVSLKGDSKSQIAGFGNLADEVEGIQAAGFINVARKVKGVQLSGFINICDSIDGVAISFINLVRQNGYCSYEFSASEWAPIQFTFKMGTKEFYNIYSISKLVGSWDKYTFGFGFGHSRKLSDGTDLCLDLVHHNTFSIAYNTNRWNNNYYNRRSMLQLRPTFKRSIGNGVCLNFGPTLNYNYGFWQNNNTNYMIQPFWKLLNASDETPNTSKLWVGFTAGISIN